jgi:hypothetical protein
MFRRYNCHDCERVQATRKADAQVAACASSTISRPKRWRERLAQARGLGHDDEWDEEELPGASRYTFMARRSRALRCPMT